MTRCAAAFLAFLLTCDPGLADPATVTSTPLDLGAKARHVCQSEDGRLLLACHPDEGKLTLIDAFSGTDVRTIKVPTPHWALIRKDRIFVANGPRGTVQAYSLRDGTLQDEHRLGSDSVTVITAPQGAHFSSILLAGCMGPKALQGRVVRIDLPRGAASLVDAKSFHDELVTFRFDGRGVL